MQLHPLKLVTIIAEQILQEQIVAKVLELGAKGCTWTEAKGEGTRGARKDAMSGNVRIEVVCSSGTADAIISVIAEHYFKNYACIAWTSDVAVMHGATYAG